jgi:hypothetical protein
LGGGEIVSAVAAALDALESQVAALGAFQGTEPSFLPVVPEAASFDMVNAINCC